MTKRFDEIPFASVTAKIPANELTTMYPADKEGKPNLAQAILCIKGQADWNHHHHDKFHDAEWQKSSTPFQGYSTGYAVNEQTQNLVHFSGRDMYVEQGVIDTASVESLAQQSGIVLSADSNIIHIDMAWFLDPRFFRPDMLANDKRLQAIFKKLEKPQRHSFPLEPAWLFHGETKVDKTLNMEEIALLATRIREISQQGLNTIESDGGFGKVGKFRHGDGITRKDLEKKGFFK